MHSSHDGRRMLRIVLALLALVFVAPAHAWRIGGGGLITISSGTGPGGPVATLIQHISSESNPWPGNGISGNNFVATWPNPVQSGDALICGVSYPNGHTVTITDNLGNTWPSASVTADDGAGNMVAAIFVLPNSAGGSTSTPGTLTFGVGASVQPFEYTCSEFNNIATSSPLNGTKSGAGLVGATISPGSFTPTTNNDTNGGNLIWNYTALSRTPVSVPTGWSAGSSFTLLDAGIYHATVNSILPHASQIYVQRTQASVTPSITSTGDTTDHFNSVTVALLAANAGGSMPSGIHINKIQHFTDGAPPATWTLDTPATGNLRVLATTTPTMTISSVTDSDSSCTTGWHVQNDNGGSGATIAWAGNCTPNANLTVTIHNGGGAPTTSVRFVDVQGAAASPFDTSAGNTPTSCPAGGNTSAAPSITPSTANGLVIAAMPMGQGPVHAVVGPTNAIFDLVHYTGETDFDSMENADAQGHFYNPTTAAETWSWSTDSISGGNCQGTEAVAFKGQ